MQELFLVRHGESVHHVQGLTGGWTNTPLTELGRKQAQLTGQELEKLLPNSSVGFYTSDLERALQTAQIIGSIIGVTPVAKKALRELHWGIAMDMTLEEARKLEREKTEPLLDWVPFPEAESWRMLHQRITPFLEQLDKTESGSVLIVSHGNAIEECIFWWLEISLDQRRKLSFTIAPCSITHLCTNDWQQKVVTFANRVRHLQSLSL
ncbi:MAG: histidine phosphatase family protein [Promethearchaeota archaeon]